MKTSPFKKLDTDISVEIAIVGGGLAGIDTAYMLAQAGVEVAVFEAKTVGSGATSKTTAFLTQVIDTNVSDLVSMFGLTKTKLLWESHGRAIDAIESIVKKEKIECGFMRCPSYSFAQTEKEQEELKEEFQTYDKLGIKTIFSRKSSALPFANHGFLNIANQGKYNAHAFIQAVAQKAADSGARIYERSPVSHISGQKTIKLTVGKHTIKANKIVIVTYDPFGNPKPTHFKKGMYTSYVFEVEIPKNYIPEAIYEDMKNPYHYFRIDQGDTYDTMIVGGEDHRAELPMNPKKNFAALERFLKDTFPSMEYKIKSRWTGPILEPSDGLPLIGEYEPNKYVACAFSGNGMTYSMITALMLQDLVQGKTHPWTKLYDPTRTLKLKRLAIKARDYTGEFFGGAAKNIFKPA